MFWTSSATEVSSLKHEFDLFWLLQSRLSSHHGPQQSSIVCEDCGQVITNNNYGVNVADPASDPLHVEVGDQMVHGGRVDSYQKPSEFSYASTIARTSGETFQDSYHLRNNLPEPNFVTGTQIVIDGGKVEISKPGMIQERICWSCNSRSSLGPWHRHKTTPNKFLCNRCLHYFKMKNAEIKFLQMNAASQRVQRASTVMRNPQF